MLAVRSGSTMNSSSLVRRWGPCWKAAATVRAEDFRGLTHLRERLGDRFRLGLVLYTGARTLSFGPRLKAVPIAALWESDDG